MDLKRIAKDTAKTLTSYLTYQAVRVVMGQLKETDIPRSYWFNEFATREKLQDGEAFIASLMQEQADLALRVMTVRQHLAEEVTEFLPEMVMLLPMLVVAAAVHAAARLLGQPDVLGGLLILTRQPFFFF